MTDRRPAVDDGGPAAQGPVTVGRRCRSAWARAVTGGPMVPIGVARAVLVGVARAVTGGPAVPIGVARAVPVAWPVL